MKHKLTKNLSLKLLSLLVAFIIWLVVANLDNPIKSRLFSDVKIQVVNEDSVTEIDKVFDIISDETVVIKVTERRSVLNALSRDDFTVTADLENLTDMNTVPLTVSCSNASVTWDEISISPSSVKVQLEQRTQSDFVITVATTGTPANGYEVGSTEVVQGKTVQIAGSETMLNRIGQVIATVNVDRIRADQRLSSELKILDKNGDELKDAQMSRLQIKDSSGVLLADNSVMVDVYLWEVMSDIPVDIETEGRPADGYRVTGISTTPSAVNLVGTHDALDQIGEKLTLNEPISVEGATESFTVDYDISETLNEYSDLRLAKDVDPTVSVSVQIEKNSEQTIAMPLSSLDVSSRPENMTLTFSPADEISIVIEADDGSMPNIQLSDIRAGIDLSICEEPGTYEIPVEVQLPDGYQLASQVSLVVTATRQEQPTENQDEEGQN